MFHRFAPFASSLRLLAFVGLGLGFGVARAFDLPGSPGGRPRSGRALLPLLALPLVFGRWRTHAPFGEEDEVLSSDEGTNPDQDEDEDEDGDEGTDEDELYYDFEGEILHYGGDGAGDDYDPDNYDEENRPCDWDYPSDPDDEDEGGNEEDPDGWPFDDHPYYSDGSSDPEDDEGLPIVIMGSDGSFVVVKGCWDGDLDNCILIHHSQDESGDGSSPDSPDRSA